MLFHHIAGSFIYNCMSRSASQRSPRTASPRPAAPGAEEHHPTIAVKG